MIFRMAYDAESISQRNGWIQTVSEEMQFLETANGRLQETKKRDPAEGAGTENGGDFSHRSGTEMKFRYYVQDSR